MARRTETLTATQAERLDEIKKHWGWILALGVLLSALGVIGLAMVLPVATPNMLIFSILLLAGSGAHLIQMYRVFGWRNRVTQGLIALLYLVLAVLIYVDPVAASVSLTLVLGLVLIGVGSLRVINGVNSRPLPGWVWLTGTGAAELLLAAWVLSGWPVTGLWVIGLVISLDLLIGGIAYIGLAFRLYRRVMPA